VFFLDSPLLNWPRAASPGEVWQFDAPGEHLRELAPYGGSSRRDDVWESGLELFLDGLEARLGR
jgi:hypothetical protein